MMKPWFSVGISVSAENGVINIIAFILIVSFIASSVEVSINAWNASKVIDISVSAENSVISTFKLTLIVGFIVSGIGLDIGDLITTTMSTVTIKTTKILIISN